MIDVPWIPLKERNPYTVWYKYAGQNVNRFNYIAIHYNMGRLQMYPPKVSRDRNLNNMSKMYEMPNMPNMQ